jgi:hypothetical protein
MRIIQNGPLLRGHREPTLAVGLPGETRIRYE